jgi:phosphatidylethanolamine-binding protein (PEBP) family uncharacterized protein
MRTRKYRCKYRRKRVRKTLKKRKTPRKKGGQIPGLEVRYPSGIVRGQTFTKEETKDAPQILFNPEQGKLYTILMYDPDAPAKPSWVHWIITNISNLEQIPNNIVLPYQGPNPPSGTHLYYFGLYEQLHGKISPMISGIRGNFDYTEFIQENYLLKINVVYFRVTK